MVSARTGVQSDANDNDPEDDPKDHTCTLITFVDIEFPVNVVFCHSYIPFDRRLNEWHFGNDKDHQHAN